MPSGIEAITFAQLKSAYTLGKFVGSNKCLKIESLYVFNTLNKIRQ